MSPVNRGAAGRPAANTTPATARPLASKTQAPTVAHAQAAAGAVSFDPSTFTSGGLIDDVDVIIHDAQFVMWDYDGHQPTESPALGLTLRIINPDNTIEDKDYDQYYSCGKAEDFVPGDAGAGEGSILLPVGAKTGVNNSTNCALLITSFINCGVPIELLAPGNCKAWVGMGLHVNRVPQPKRNNQAPGDKARDVLVATKLLFLPSESGQAAPAPAPTRVAAPVATRPTPAPARPVAAAAPAPATTTSGVSEDVDAAATQAVLTILAAEGSIQRRQIGPKVFAALKGDQNQAAAMKWAFTEEFLLSGTATEPPMWAYDGATITPAA